MFSLSTLLGLDYSGPALTERVWMPYAVIGAEARRPGASLPLFCLVDRIHGDCYRLEERPQPAAIAPQQEAFAAEIGLDACRTLATRFLGRSLVVRRAASYELRVLTSDPYLYPLWVGYTKRRKGRYALRLLDAVTGKAGAAGVKRALLTALRTADQSL